MNIKIRRKFALNTFFALILFLCNFVMGNGAERITIQLKDIDSGLTSPTGDYRWRDIADQLYSDAYQTSYNYTQAQVFITYEFSGETLQGTMEALNLKPNFAYQLKLVGTPGTPDNERIGLAGRWWQEEWDGSKWASGQNLNNKGDGSSPNPNDDIYFLRRDIADFSSPTGLRYRYTGYHVFDYFITDEYGNAIVDFEVNSSYHVLWKESQRTPTSSDGPPKSSTFDPDPILPPIPAEDAIYEDAEDGSINGWMVYASLPAGAEINNVFDEDRQSLVIELTGSGTSNGYRLRNDDGSKWHNSSQFIVEWSMKYSEYFFVYMDVETTAGHRFIFYRPDEYDGLGSGEYVHYGLGSHVIDGEWHTFVRDLQADLEKAQPGEMILEVNGFLIRGSGRVDDIRIKTSAYDLDYFSHMVSIFGEWERLPVGGVMLNPGDYFAQIILTEESLHGSGGTFAGNWAGAMGAEIQLQILNITEEVFVYEDAEDGTINGWEIYANNPAGAEISNVFDEDRQSLVIELAGSGTSNGYRLRNDDGSKWHNSSHFVVEWSMKYSEYFVVYMDIETTAGHRFIFYRPDDYSGLGSGEYVHYGLGSHAMDGEWHTFMRDLQVDLEEAQPGEIILEVNGFLVRGSGRVDDIKLKILSYN